jgi:hypothetical protein
VFEGELFEEEINLYDIFKSYTGGFNLISKLSTLETGKYCF